MIRVLIVDDSAVLRQSTRLILESDPEVQVIGEAANGLDAVHLADRLHPDVITMDIRMPKMDGVEAIREIMAETPAPIIVVTGLDLERETGLSQQMARLGAVSVVQRPEGLSRAGLQAFGTKLIEQVKLMSTVRVIRRTRAATPAREIASAVPPPAGARPPARKTEIVAIGSSTGGPAALHKILSEIPATFPLPIVIVQHISFGFVDGLASWLNDASPLRVKVGQPAERLQAGVVYVAPDNTHMLVDRFSKINLLPSEPVGGHRPAVTMLFQSVAQSYGPTALAVLLTGMGSDGAVGMRSLREAGAITVAQDQASCVVFGMPKEAIALGVVQHVVPLDRMALMIQEFAVN